MDSKFRFRLADVTILLSFTGISLILLISLLSEIPLVAFILLAVMVFEVRRGYRVMIPLTQGAGDRGPSHHQDCN
jgi:hypothetical protein